MLIGYNPVTSDGASKRCCQTLFAYLDFSVYAAIEWWVAVAAWLLCAPLCMLHCVCALCCMCCMHVHVLHVHCAWMHVVHPLSICEFFFLS